MRRVKLSFSLLAVLGLMFTAPNTQYQQAEANPILNRRITSSQTVLDRLKAIGGLTFFKNYAGGGSLNAEFSVGSPIATYTVSRSATNPQTYIDANGIIQVNTTSNTRVFKQGYYDTTGFHAGNRGELIEAAGTNLLVYSNDYSVANWTKTATVGTDSISMPDGSSGGANLVTITGVTQNLFQSVAVTAGDVYTFSFFAQAGTLSSSPLYAIYDETNQTFVVSDVAYTPKVGGWNRTSATVTAPAGCSSLRFYLIRNPVGTGTIHFWGAQVEKSPYATSFIPTTTAALTRNAPVLKYENAGNATAATETIFVKFAPGWDETNKGNNNNTLLNSDTKNRTLNTGWVKEFSFVPNASDSIGCKATYSNNAAFDLNTSKVYAATLKHSSPYVALYINGVAVGTDETSDDFTNPDWGTFFYVGVNNAGAAYINSTIQAVVRYNRALSTAEVAAVTAILQSIN